MATYTLISSITLSSSAANMEFTSIPATFTDLVVSASLKNTGGGADIFRVTLNNSAADYSFKNVEGSSAAASGSTFGAGAYAYGGYCNGASNTASTFSSTDIYIPNYLSSNKKSFSSSSTLADVSTQDYSILIENLWSNTAAITSIKLIAETNSFATYSSAYLYGISNA